MKSHTTFDPRSLLERQVFEEFVRQLSVCQSDNPNFVVQELNRPTIGDPTGGVEKLYRDALSHLLVLGRGSDD